MQFKEICKYRPDEYHGIKAGSMLFLDINVNHYAMRNVLIPTDFSDNAYNAICYAMKLFMYEKCTFYFLNTYTPAVYDAEYILHSPGQIGLGDIYQTDSMTKLEQLRDRIVKEFNNPKHTFMIHSAFNILVDEIMKTIENEHIDLVIMGTQGATGAKEILLGTNTVHVIKKAKCPVIAVPPQYYYEAPKEILFPTDYEVDYQKEQFNELFNIATQHKSRIDVLHISHGFDLTVEQLESKSKLINILDNTTHLIHDISDSEIIAGINDFQLKNKSKFLVMIQNKHTFLERLFVEPVIKKIGFHVTIPFMVIPHQT